jgi:hypothetical protein
MIDPPRDHTESCALRLVQDERIPLKVEAKA